MGVPARSNAARMQPASLERQNVGRASEKVGITSRVASRLPSGSSNCWEASPASGDGDPVRRRLAVSGQPWSLRAFGDRQSFEVRVVLLLGIAGSLLSFFLAIIFDHSANVTRGHMNKYHTESI